jgi:hypothetical protein
MRKLITGLVIVELLSASGASAQDAGGESKRHPRHHHYAPLTVH